MESFPIPSSAKLERSLGPLPAPSPKAIIVFAEEGNWTVFWGILVGV